MLRSFVLLFVGLIFSAVTPVEAAEKVPYSALAKDYEGCLTGSAALKEWSSAYCICVSVELRNTLTLKEYLLLSSEAMSAIGESGKVDAKKARVIEGIREISATCQKGIASEM